MERAPKDDLILACIRRVNLDAFWSRERSTVEDQACKARYVLKLSEELGLPVAGFENPGPLPDYDHCRYRVAVLSVYDSLRPGKYSSTHKQWDTVRRLRTVFANQA